MFSLLPEKAAIYAFMLRYLEQKLRMKDIGNEQNRCKDHDYLSYIKLKYYVVEGTSAAYNPTLFKNKRTNARQTGRTWPGKNTFQGVGGVGSQGLKNALINTEVCNICILVCVMGSTSTAVCRMLCNCHVCVYMLLYFSFILLSN